MHDAERELARKTEQPHELVRLMDSSSRKVRNTARGRQPPQFRSDAIVELFKICDDSLRQCVEAQLPNLDRRTSISEFVRMCEGIVAATAEGWQHLQLYRSAKRPPPFEPPCSWAGTEADAETRRGQLIWQHGGHGTIWTAEFTLGPTELLDVRDDTDRGWEILGQQPAGRLRDAMHEGVGTLTAKGYSVVAFREQGQPGDEYIYLRGRPVKAVRARP